MVGNREVFGRSARKTTPNIAILKNSVSTAFRVCYARRDWLGALLLHSHEASHGQSHSTETRSGSPPSAAITRLGLRSLGTARQRCHLADLCSRTLACRLAAFSAGSGDARAARPRARIHPRSHLETRLA